MILTTAEILQRIPHRPPFMFIDRIEALDPGRSASGLARFGPDSFVFDGHFPGRPIVPGVMLIECVAQVAAVMFASGRTEQPAAPGSDGHYLAVVDHIAFKRPVGPDEVLRIEVSLAMRLGRVVKVHGRVTTGELLVAEGDLVLSDVRTAEAWP